ncbi:MAG: hypothetical protein L3J12_06510, partial [Spirochaetales bacterium]|nr:hypothetical protein [Spirochaetales bacterium]
MKTRVSRSVLLLVWLLFISIIVFSGCKAPVKEGTGSSAVKQKADAVESETGQPESQVQTRITPAAADDKIVQTDKDAVEESKEEQSASEPPSMETAAVIPESDNISLFKNIATLIPLLPEGASKKPILISAPIPGKPVIAIYRIREGRPGDPVTEKENGTAPEESAEPDIALKPEPTIVIAPEPTIVPDLEPDIVIESQPKIVTVPVPEIAIEEPFIDNLPEIAAVHVQKNPVESPVLSTEPEIVAATVPKEPESEVEPVTEEPVIVVEAEPVPAQIAEVVTVPKEPEPAVESVTEEPIIVVEAESVPAQIAEVVTVPKEPEPEVKPVIEEPVIVVKSEPAPVPDASQEQTQPVLTNILPPRIEIVSPASGTFYTKKIQIEGRIANSEEDPESVSNIEKVTWEIEGQKEPEELFFGSDGVFFLSFPATDFSGEIDFIVKAENKDSKLSRYTLKLFDGNVTPELTLESPARGSVYGAAIQISGRVTDPSASSLNLTGPERLSYSLFSVSSDISEKQTEGIIYINSDGSFLTDIFTDNISGEQLLTITAEGRNGRTVKSSVTLAEGESDIPGFKVEQENGSIRLSWDTLPGTESYNIFYSEKGSDPLGLDGKKFSNLESPVFIRNFKEGFLYRFQVEAVSVRDNSSGQKNYLSGIKETIILTGDTLKPVVTPGYQQISLVWLNIPGSEEFDVLRDEDSSGNFQVIKPSVTGTSYVDRDVVFGKQYSYKIKPVLSMSTSSYAASASSLPFPEEKSVVLGRYGSSNLQGITVAGSYIFLADGVGGLKIIDNADSNNPLEVGRFPTEDARDIIIRGERAYIADGYRGIKILDINDPGSPILLGSRKTTDASKLVLSGDTVYIADGKSGIKIIDISSERRPVRSGFLDTEYAKDIVIHGSEILIADGSGGFKIAEIKNLSTLKLVGSIDYSDAVSVAVKNNTAYIADSGYGVRIVDISSPDSPV